MNIYLKTSLQIRIKCPKIQEIRDVMVNGQATLKCLQDKGRVDKYKLGCYINGELLSKKTAKLRKLKKWAAGEKQGFYSMITIILLLALTLADQILLMFTCALLFMNENFDFIMI